MIDTTMISTVQIQGFQGGGKFSSYPSFSVIIPTPGIFNNGSSPIASLAITGATASGAFLSAAVYNSNTISITADAGNLSPGIYRGSVTIASNAANNTAVSIPVIFIVLRRDRASSSPAALSIPPHTPASPSRQGRLSQSSVCSWPLPEPAP